MSFGFGVGDFVATAQLAWHLYKNCYKVAKGAPHDFQLLLQEIHTTHGSIQLIQEEAINPDSTLVRAGADRVKMVKDIIAQVDDTLQELGKHAKKYEKVGDQNRGRMRQWWTGVKWSSEAPDLDALRNKVGLLSKTSLGT